MRSAEPETPIPPNKDSVDERLSNWWLRVRLPWRGALRRSRSVSEILGFLALVGALASPRGSHRHLSLMLIAARRLRLPLTRKILRQVMAPWLSESEAKVWRAKRVGWERYYEGFGGLQKKSLTTSLLLKAPGQNGEKGVLYSSFEYNWIRILEHANARKFFDEYILVGASSGAALDYAAYASLTGIAPDPIFVGVSNLAQIREFKLLEPAIRALPILASDWVNPAHFSPKPFHHRTIDILMVANWLELKRHWLLFEALRKLDHRLRVVLIGRRAPGRTEDTILREARAFGVKQRIEILNNVPFEEVASHQCDAKVALILSDREGSCVATAECLFADAPVIMMADAYVGSKAYINERTGRLSTRRALTRHISELLTSGDSLSPRQWMLRNTGAEISSRRLNDALKQEAEARRLPWTKDITPMEWRYVPAYFEESSAQQMAPAIMDLRERHGIELARFEPPPRSNVFARN